MILDIDYSKYSKKLTISYVNENGSKSFLESNVARFKSFEFDECGEFDNWNGRKCREIKTENPSKFDIKTFINELPDNRKNLLFQKKFPNLYTFDIETDYNPLEKPDPNTAKFPITTISICSPSMNTLVLGTRKCQDEEKINERYIEYCKSINIYNELELDGKFMYKYFDNEGDMLLYFLKNIVAKCTVLSGWNIWGFDWQYIENRLKNYYPSISIKNASPVFRTKVKRVPGFFNKEERITLNVPQHTLLIDMMDIIQHHDHIVLPMKESMSLDWIAKHSIKSQKVEYDGTLDDLYKSDYDTYVLYNAIDSALVQLIDKHFKTMQLMYIYSNIAKIPIGECVSMIALAEGLFFEQFYSDGKKVVWVDRNNIDRGELQGAYVKQPIPGKYNFALCFDFAGLYPSQVMTCNLSVENFIHPPESGWTDKQLEKFRQDSNYFVSINNHVYKNDKDYAFKKIQMMLKENRNNTKYIAKKLDAQVMSQIDDKLSGHNNNVIWDDDIREYMNNNYGINSIEDMDINILKSKLHEDITYKIMEEQAFKLVGNSCYGGSSHVYFFWFNMSMANDITGESRNLFKLMDKLANEELGSKFSENKPILKVIDKLGYSIDKDVFNEEFKKVKDVVIYGDTDSNYLVINHILKSLTNFNEMTDHQKAEFCVKISEDYLNPLFNNTLTNFFKNRHVDSVHNFELETVAKTGIWLNVKKRYAQSILWKDGRYYDNPVIKVKGLEIVKSSTPSNSRRILKDMMRVLLFDDGDDMSIVHKLNNISQKELRNSKNIEIDELSESINVNGYSKYVEDDKSGLYPRTAKGTPFQVAALAYYNWLINTNNYQDDNLYGGRMKVYIIDDGLRRKTCKDRYFAFQSESLPKWSQQEAPISYHKMHEKTVLNPINRILEDIGMKKLSLDGSISMNDLFSFF